jgi:enoyl-CoA hydratase/carnithine racemase
VQTLLVTSDQVVTTITLNRPHRKNAIDPTMWRELAQVFADLSTSSQRVVVLTGAGDGFCSGADLSQPLELTDAMASDGTLAYMRGVGEVALALHQLPMPTIAFVNGVAAGAGVNLALGCDLVYAAPSARFGELFAQRGLAVDFGGSWLLPRIVGVQRAKELVFLADFIDAPTAHSIGLITEVTDSDDGLTEVYEIARKIASRAPNALRHSKRLLNGAVDADLAACLEAEAIAQDHCFASAEFAEAVEAFQMKRNPDFGGQ